MAKNPGDIIGWTPLYKAVETGHVNIRYCLKPASSDDLKNVGALFQFI
jgi:hypothetical protein